MASETKHRILLFGILLAAVFFISGFSILALYNGHFEEERKNLRQEARVWAKFLNAVGEFDARHSSDFPGGAQAATLSQFKKAQQGAEHAHLTKEVILGQPSGDRIRIIYRENNDAPGAPPSEIPWDSPSAEPLRRALAGNAGIMENLDHKGRRVLAVYEPIPLWNAGLVMQVHMDELTEPYWRAALFSTGAGLVVAFLGTAFVSRRTQSRPAGRQRKLEETRNLKASPERLIGIIEATPDIIGISDENGYMAYLNPEGRKILGYGEDEDLGGKHIQEVHPEEDFERIRREGLPTAEKNGQWIGETHFKTKDGRAIPVRQVILCHKEPNGMRYFSTIAHDLSETRKFQRQLEESRNMLQTILDSLPVHVFWQDRELKYLGCNEPFAKVSGWGDPALLVGKTDFDMAWYKNAENYRADNKEVIETGEKKLNFEEPLSLSDGSEHVVKTSLVPLADLDGNIIGVLGIFEDITEFKNAEKRLRESEVRFRSAFETAPIGMALVTLEGRFFEINPALCKLLGYSSEELLTLEWKDVTHPEDLDTGRKQLSQLFAEEIEYLDMEKRYIHKSGDTVWARVTVGVVRDEEERPEYLLAQMEDITDRKRAEKVVAASQKLAAVGQLTAGLCHEMLNPLNVISMKVQLLDRRNKENPELRNFCNKVQNEIGHIKTIVMGLMTFSGKGESGERQKRPLELRDVMQDVLILVDKELALKSIAIEKQLPEERLPVLGDKDQLHQVFINLINNARYAMTAGGTLTVGCRAVEKHGERRVQAFVQDTGVGISKETLDNIFTPFFTTKPEGEGTGMGLSIAHGIIEEHGGTIFVESEEGRGTTFYIELPVSRDVEATA